MPNPIKAVLFDLGGTLIYFDGNWVDVAEAANRELLQHLLQQGMHLDSKRFLDEFRKRLEEYYMQREMEFIEYTTAHILRTLLADLGYPGVTLEMMAPALKQLYAVSQAHWKLEEDTLPTLEALRRTGYRMAVVSNAADDADVQRLVDNAGIRGYLDLVLSSAACGTRKPNPRIFQIALEQWKLTPSEAVMVGDTLGADILGARNAGIYSIWITRRADRPANRDHAGTIQPDTQIQTLAELPEKLQTLSNMA
jgi:2-haloalkanoic acid dehalogenase type II